MINKERIASTLPKEQGIVGKWEIFQSTPRTDVVCRNILVREPGKFFSGYIGIEIRYNKEGKLRLVTILEPKKEEFQRHLKDLRDLFSKNYFSIPIGE